ncbi:MAG: DUF2959 domain-containing protein [Lentisphaerae bacterium]|nr:DUF2959 domain-containing protein [Lentisphaerota bacterium]
MNTRLSMLAAVCLVACGCSTMYYGAMEKMGVHKRDIMKDRVKEARDTQSEAKAQFVSAMEQFRRVVHVQGGDLEREYNQLNATLQRSEAEANAVHTRIRAVEDVSDALFKEWRQELKQYSSDSLRKSSQRKYDMTRAMYKELIASMKAAESKLEPVLVPLRDQVLFMKHNLNAKAIAGLGDEVLSVQTNVDSLVRELDAAIAQADKFIASLETE